MTASQSKRRPAGRLPDPIEDPMIPGPMLRPLPTDVFGLVLLGAVLVLLGGVCFASVFGTVRWALTIAGDKSLLVEFAIKIGDLLVFQLMLALIAGLGCLAGRSIFDSVADDFGRTSNMKVSQPKTTSHLRGFPNEVTGSQESL